MILLFARSRTLISWLIRLDTWSPWSHVAMLTPDGTVIEARFPGLKALLAKLFLRRPAPGVREVALADFIADNGVIQPVVFPVKDVDAGMAWARTQVGCEYDWSGLFGFIVHRLWAHTKEWWCSELATMVLEKAFTPYLDPSAVNRATPQDLWQLAARRLPFFFDVLTSHPGLFMAKLRIELAGERKVDHKSHFRPLH
jgi:hypothetical protein